MRRENHAAGVVDEHIIHAPGIHADRGESWKTPLRLAQAGGDLRPQPGQVPVVVPTDRAELIGKTVHLGERQLPPVPWADDDAAADRAEVHRPPFDPSNPSPLTF